MPATHQTDGYPSKPTLSVIIAVYNHFEWLRLVLEGLRHQTVRKFQIILADDGSNDTTVNQIRRYMEMHPDMEIVHLWHEDDGWRKNIILNKAVARAEGDYLCFLDSDCIPAPDWAADHLRLATPKTVIAGRRATFAPFMSKEMETRTSLSPGWFRQERLRFIFNFRKFPAHCHPGRVIRLPILSGKGFLQRTTGNLIGCNFGIYRKDLTDINGFDERYLGPGLGEDIDIAYRLRFNGCRIMKVPHQALTLHRHHPTSVSTVKSKTDNVALLEKTKEKQIARTPYGIVKTAETQEL